MVVGNASVVRRIRRADSLLRFRQNVIPANAGIQRLQRLVAIKPWMPAFAGMTVR